MRMSPICKHLKINEFEELSKMNFLINKGHKDKDGHPILYLVVQNIHLRNISHEHLNRFVCFTLDKMCYDMQADIDNLVLIIDCHKFSYKNWS